MSISFCRGERLFARDSLTICTHRRQCLLGAMVDGRVILSSIGRIVYEHVIRSEKELNRIRDYIENNPLRLQIDRENPDRKTNRARSTIEEDVLYPC